MEKLDTIIKGLSVTSKQASNIGSTEYESTFKFGDFELDQFCNLLPVDFSNRKKIDDLVETYTTAILQNMACGNVDQKSFVQPVSCALLKGIMDFTFRKAHISYCSERYFVCNYQGMVYKGRTDHALIPTAGDAAALVWEDKNITYDFSIRSKRQSALCQVAAEIYAEVDKLKHKYNIVVGYFCAILTSGSCWYLVAYYVNNGVRQWRHSSQICTIHENGEIDRKGMKNVTKMLKHALASAKRILEEVRNRKISASPYLNDNMVDEDDTDDGKDGGSDSGKEVDPEPTNALSKLVAGTLRISPRSKTAGNGKGNGSKESRNNSGSTRLYKHELLLTEDNLAEHDKENCYWNPMPYRIEFD